MYNILQKPSLLDLPKSIKPDNLSVNKICISEPDDDNPKTPLTPETMERTPDEKPNKNQLTPTINEETELDEPGSMSCNNKSSLSLPVEPPVITPVVERDRRKLSVQGLPLFVEPLFSDFFLFATSCFFYIFIYTNINTTSSRNSTYSIHHPTTQCHSFILACFSFSFFASSRFTRCVRTLFSLFFFLPNRIFRNQYCMLLCT